MRHRLAFAALFIAIALVWMPACPAAEADAIHVGAASATINPKEGTFLAGYQHNRRSTGVHDDLHAKAVVFWDGTTAVGLVVLDSISVQYDTTNAIRDKAAQAVTKIPLPPERVLVQAIHTHCAPDTIGIYGADVMHTGRDPAYMAMLIETAAQQVVRAVDALGPARIAWAETECTGWAVNDSEPGVVDHSVTILQCLDPQGKSIATLTNFACHPTVLDGDTTLTGADWVGAFYKGMAGVPGEHLFLQGAVGGWIQPKTPERTFALAEQYGTDLAQKTVAALKNTKPLEGAKVRFANRRFQMPVPNPVFQMMAGQGLIPRAIGQTAETEVAWFSVGSAQFATHPAETAPAFSWKTEELMDSAPKFVLGLGLDHLGYIIKPEYFDRTDDIPHASYLTSMSPGREAGSAMMAALDAIIP